LHPDPIIAHHDRWMNAINVVALFFRALHVLSAITLVGGAMAWRFAAIPSENTLAADTRAKLGNATAGAWRPWVLTAIAGLIVSGIYNFLHKTGMTSAYHAIFGIKILLALHVFAAVILAARPDNQRRSRQLAGVVVSGIIIVILSAVLRGLTLR
jgi:uncharacterized membrane protein